MRLFSLIIFSLLSLNLIETTLANQSVAMKGGKGEDNGGIHKCTDKERQALLHFKAPLQDPDGRLSTWRADKHDCCEWEGVTCNSQIGRVTRLDLRFYGLVGDVSNSLLNLTYLNYLQFYGNSFHGTIPRSIGSLTKLRHLYLIGNSFSGTIPRSISSLTKLRDLDLSSNSFNGTIPRSIGSLTELRYLNLSSNYFHGTIPPEFGNLTNLQVLSLESVGKCRVENIGWLSRLSHLQLLLMQGISLAKANHWVDVILSLRNLSELSLQGCELSHVMYPSSSHANFSSSIETLSLGNNRLTSSMYGWLFPLTSNNLNTLDLSGNMLDGIPKYLGNLSSLKTLSFRDNSVFIKFPDFLNNLTGYTLLSLESLYAPGSKFTGPLSDEIQEFSSLVSLVLSENQLNGTINEKLWELPLLGVLDVSSNNLRGSISENIGNSKAAYIYLSRNSLLEGVPSTDHMSNNFHVSVIDLSSCKLRPLFPKWILTLKSLNRLDISNTGISDAMPVEFWYMCSPQLVYQNFSSNNISGKVPDLSWGYHSVIDLSLNNFFGPIPNVSSAVTLLNLSRNKFHGGISSLCHMVGLQFLDLSYNFLSGKLPDCLWHFKQLKVLNLEYNNLSGNLPPSIGSLIQLEALYLYKNDFFGELPSALKNCTSLKMLNLGANKFSGNVPLWIGENLQGLYALNLGPNNFLGTIPYQLCQLKNLQILDLSTNHLQGNIPSCLNNLTSMVQQGFSQVQNAHHYPLYFFSRRYDGIYVDHALIGWQGAEREFIKGNLVLLKMIVLSSNNLTGQIPPELTDLYDLVALNLSKNSLLGKIPPKIGEMKKLFVIDLSENKFSGEIPSSMSQMSSLSYLDVSSNNLSGRIPSSTQLQSFEASRYNGNVGLCGLPLTKKCSGDEESNVPSVVGESDIDELQRWFYIGGGSGFAIGFWIACGALIYNHRGRHAFYRIYDRFKDWLYVKVVVFIAHLQRVESR